MPVDVKDAFRRSSDEQFLKKIGQMWEDDEQRGIEVIQKFGKEHIVLTKEETDEFGAGRPDFGGGGPRGEAL